MKLPVNVSAINKVGYTYHIVFISYGASALLVFEHLHFVPLFLVNSPTLLLYENFGVKRKITVEPHYSKSSHIDHFFMSTTVFYNYRPSICVDLTESTHTIKFIPRECTVTVGMTF